MTAEGLGSYLGRTTYKQIGIHISLGGLLYLLQCLMFFSTEMFLDLKVDKAHICPEFSEFEFMNWSSESRVGPSYWPLDPEVFLWSMFHVNLDLINSSFLCNVK